jgi:hypothetical protein
MILKISSFFPGLFCRKKTFPLLASNKATNTIRKIGLVTIIPNNESTKSDKGLKKILYITTHKFTYFFQGMVIFLTFF